MFLHTVEWTECRKVSDVRKTFRLRAYGRDVGWVVFERPESEVWWTEVETTEAHLRKIRQQLQHDVDPGAD